MDMIIGAVAFVPLLTAEESEQLMTGIDEEGIAEDRQVETQYSELCEISYNAESKFLRVVGDDDAVDVEVRVPLRILQELGFEYSPKA